MVPSYESEWNPVGAVTTYFDAIGLAVAGRALAATTATAEAAIAKPRAERTKKYLPLRTEPDLFVRKVIAPSRFSPIATADLPFEC